MVHCRDGSTSVMSASAPGWMAPFLGYSPYRRAVPSLRTQLRRSGVIRPPHMQSIKTGAIVSTATMPAGALLKGMDLSSSVWGA